MVILLGLVILIFSAILHEVAHGYVADRLGDPTARLAGRLTLNPIKHLDPYMSFLLPLLLILSGSPIIFGGAKPVPVDTFNLKEGRKDIALVSLAGPLTNIVIAVLGSLLLKIFFPHSLPLSTSFMAIIQIILTTIVNYNLLLAIFNLLPIPPLDGSKIFALLLPEKEAKIYLSIGQLGNLLLIFLLLFPIAGFSLEHFIYLVFTLAKTFLGVF